MKGFLSLILVSIALLQTAAAAPAVSERSQAVKKSEGEQKTRRGIVITDSPEIETKDVEKRNFIIGFYRFSYANDDDLENSEGYRSARTLKDDRYHDTVVSENRLWSILLVGGKLPIHLFHSNVLVGCIEAYASEIPVWMVFKFHMSETRLEEKYMTNRQGPYRPFP
ncbi:hypothetical protein F4604DRAFT_1924646 [Suillus subluteus]|nr:hypothetical protein F4604DRAFT_1924646 [Suillus subluteus]